MVPNRSGTPSRVVPLPAAITGFLVGIALMLLFTLYGARTVVGLWGVRGFFAVAELLLVLPILVAAYAFGVQRKAVLGVGRPSGAQWALTAGLSVAFWLLAGGVLGLQQLVWPFPPELLQRFRELHAALRPTGPLDALLSVGAIAIAPALAEEILVRGILLPSLEPVASRRWAIVLSAVAFALLHSDPHLLAFTFLLGLFLGWLRFRSGTLLLPILTHALFNSITFVLAPFVDSGDATPDPLGATLLLAGGLALGVPLLRILDRSFAASAVRRPAAGR